MCLQDIVSSDQYHYISYLLHKCKKMIRLAHMEFTDPVYNVLIRSLTHYVTNNIPPEMKDIHYLSTNTLFLLILPQKYHLLHQITR